MGANHGGEGVGAGVCPPNLAQSKKNVQNHTKIEKFVIRTLNQAFIQAFDPGVLAEPGVSMNLDPSPLQVGGIGCTGSCMQHENIYVLIHGMAKQVTHPFLSVPRSIRG